MSEHSKVSEPVIEEVPFTSDGIIELATNLTKNQHRKAQEKYILTYPTVYLIHRDANKKLNQNGSVAKF